MVLTFTMMLVVALLAAIFRAEFEAWMPWIAERLRRAAIQSLKGPLRDRYDEEWAAHLAETPGHVGKVLTAIGFNWASRQISIRSAFYKIGYRSTVSLSLMLKDIGRAIMFAANRCDGLLGSKLGDHVGWMLAQVGFEVTFTAMAVMHYRTKFIEDAHARLQAETDQEQRFRQLIEKLHAIGVRSDPETATAPKE